MASGDRERCPLLVLRAVKLSLCASPYANRLESAAAEHRARYRLLDGEAQNAARLIEELRVLLQVATREAITSDMENLARAVWLLGRRSLSCSSFIWGDTSLRSQHLVNLPDLGGAWSAELILATAWEKQATQASSSESRHEYWTAGVGWTINRPAVVSATARCHHLSAYREDWPGRIEEARWKS